MGKMIGLEIKKIRHTFLQLLIIAAIVAPIAMISVMYAVSEDKTFYEVVAGNCVFAQLIPFAITVICGCYIVAREYKDNMMLYLKVTPQSQIKIMLSKSIVIIVQVCVIQILTFVLLFVINTIIDGYDTDSLLKYIEVGLISAGTLSCLVPLIVFISLIRRSISGSALILLVLLMLTFPYIFSASGYIFPHLLPMILIAKFFGNAVYDKISYLYGAIILMSAAAIFLFLSIRITKMKEK